MTKRLSLAGLVCSLTLLTGAVLHAQPYSNAVVALNPVGYWPLQETTAPASGYYVATNLGTAGAAGNGYYQTWYQPNGTGFFPTNNIVHVPGATGDGDMAMSCNTAAGQYVILPRTTNGVPNSSVTITAPFSIEAWINSANTNLGLQPIITEGRNAVALDPNTGFTNTYTGFSLGQYQNFFYWQIYNARINGNNGYPECDTTHIAPNTWYHVVATFDGTSIAIYLNGTQIGSSKVEPTNYAGQTYVVDPVSPLIIGTGTEISSLNGGVVYKGSIDEPAIYSTALNSSQISTHYAAGPGPNYAATVLADNPVIYLRLDEPAFTNYPSPATYPVAVNYGNLGTAANGVYQPGTAPGAAGPPYSGFGPSSHSVAINGFYGLVDIGGGALPAAFNPTGTNQPFTVMTWFQGNPADAPGRFQELISHSDRSWRLTMDGGAYNSGGFGTSTAGTRFNPGNGPELSFASTADVVTNGFRVNDGNWHFIAGVYDGTNDYMYVDGALAKSATGVGSIVGNNLDIILGGGPDYTIPSPNNANVYRYWDGQLAHAAFFTNALSAGQIQQLFNAAAVPPSFYVQPVSITTNAGVNVSDTAGAHGVALNYQWYQNGSPLAGQTTSTLNFTPIETNNAGSYFLVASNGNGSATSAVVQLVVYGPPMILSEPQTDIHVFAGADPVLSINSVGGQPMFFQWTLNGGAIAGATTSTFTITNAQANGTYSCTLSNFLGTASIVPVSLTVLPDPTAPYPAAVRADNPVAYYRLDEASGSIAYDYAGGFNANYTNVNQGLPGYNPGPVGSADPTDPMELCAQFGGSPNNSLAGNGTTTINFATPNGSNAEFSIEAWFSVVSFQNGGNCLVGLGYGNGGEQFVLDDGASQSGALRFFVRNASGAAFGANSTYAVNNDARWHHVVAVCDEAGGHLFLYVDGSQIATTAITTNSGILSPNPVIPLSIGARESANNVPENYDFQFFGVLDDVSIYNKALTAAQVQSHYYASGVPPLITQLKPSSSITTNQGGSITLTTAASGSPPLSYQWSDNNGSPIAGATTTSLTLTNLQQSQAGNYSLAVNNAFGSATTNISITVDLGPPVIITDLQPTNLTAFQTTTNTYSVVVSGSAPFFYQWFRDGSTVAGATNSSYSFPVLAGTNTYYVSVTNAFSISQHGGPTLSSTGIVVGVPIITLNPSNYTYSAKISFAGYNRPETLSDFPVLVRFGTNLNGFAYSQTASPTAGDLRFTDSGGARVIPYEIDEWNPGGTSSVWVQVPRLSSTNDLIIAYWGNPAAQTPPGFTTNGAVWIPQAFENLPSYQIVYHLKEGALPFADSTAQFNATNGTAPAATPGIVGQGALFNGTSDFLDAGVVNLGDNFTLSAWVNVATNASSIQTIWANQHGGYAAPGFAWFVNTYGNTDHKIDFASGDGSNGNESTTAANAVPFGEWHLLSVAVTRTNGTGTFYVDGNNVASTVAIVPDFTNYADLNLGSFTNAALWFTGTMDEARIHSTLSSSNWIWASWMTVASNSVFESYSTVNSSAVILGARISNGNLILTWSQGTLMSASHVNGAYAPVSGASPPSYSVPASAAQQFYRVKVR
jgi:Concanavalin A-like lectin/glucanases superfamily/Immunoglobulin domain/Domain of unknown function (DUF2341)